MSIKRNDVESYVGKVVDAYTRVERVMSDVYDDVLYAVVIKDDGTYECLSAYEMSAKVDASVEQIEAYKAWKVADEARRKAEYDAFLAKRQAEEAALLAAKQAKKDAQKAKNLALESGVVVAKGDVVKVVSGANKGKAGKVFWIGEGSLGTKLGIALDDEKDTRGFHKNVAWVLKKNVAKAA